jgi:hypothetical protein
MSDVVIVNDFMTCIPGTKTLWHNLMETFDGYWVGGHYQNIAHEQVFHDIRAGTFDAKCIIRNATYFPWVHVGNTPVISLVQDIQHGHLRDQQIDVCNRSHHVVFNSLHTLRSYPEVKVPRSVISLGSDDELFCLPATNGPAGLTEFALAGDVLWIGSMDTVKSPRLLAAIIENHPSLTFTIVVKNRDMRGWTFPNNARIVGPLTHKELVVLMHLHAIGLCTSSEETQHLAGIEMALCGLQMVAPPVGIYKNVPPRDITQWAIVDEPNELSKIVGLAAHSPLQKEYVREEVKKFCPTISECMAHWKRLVDQVTES